jgi:hypothetical protein
MPDESLEDITARYNAERETAEEDIRKREEEEETAWETQDAEEQDQAAEEG